ncbi:hypothetical protein BC679P5_00005 [Bacteroides phage BC679P5]|nr:hypothetical protein BC679P5_00005 [Bacteroides phage BC679P5]
MIKKYEIINDGGKKRIKALRSFHVQGRYVNLGDVGGIVYDENTLSQEGNGWIFSGNLNYPSIRVSGDSIVDTNGYEAAVTDPRPTVNITGASALIGAHDFVTGSTAEGEPIEAYLDINDSRLEFQYTSAMTVATKVNLANTTLVGVYKSVIDTSNVIISKTGNGAFVANIYADVVKCNVRFSAVSANSLLIGNFSNVSEIINDGSYSFTASNIAKNKINVRDCYTFVQSETVLPTSAIGAAPANMPFTFTRCNVPNGRFYHNARAKNIYTDIDFSKAQKDLGKISGNYYMSSSEVEGMYRLFTPANVGSMLVEDYESVRNLVAAVAAYDTTIYKDAHFNGKFEFAGTNVFGNTRKHDTQDVSGCKIVNTGETAIKMAGNIRVEGNAALTNVSITGTGYFGGNSVVSYTPAVWASLDFAGVVFMKDNAVFAPKALTGACALVRMEGNAKFIGSVDVASTNLSFIMRDNAVIEGKANTRSGVVMSGNSKVAAAGQIMAASRGVLVMEDNASIEANTTVIGAITLSGNYKGNVVKTWTGKRTITDVNAPEYDDNVKTEYDF